MTYIQTVEFISDIYHVDKQTVRRVLDAFLALIKLETLSGKDVSIRGFGKFSPKNIKGRVLFGKQYGQRLSINFKSFVRVEGKNG